MCLVINLLNGCGYQWILNELPPDPNPRYATALHARTIPCMDYRAYNWKQRTTKWVTLLASATRNASAQFAGGCACYRPPSGESQYRLTSILVATAAQTSPLWKAFNFWQHCTQNRCSLAEMKKKCTLMVINLIAFVSIRLQRWLKLSHVYRILVTRCTSGYATDA